MLSMALAWHALNALRQQSYVWYYIYLVKRLPQQTFKRNHLHPWTSLSRTRHLWSVGILLQDLLGENFRRQMLMDGQYGSITFICTKTDVIQVRPFSDQPYPALASFVPCFHQCTKRELHCSTLRSQVFPHQVTLHPYHSAHVSHSNMGDALDLADLISKSVVLCTFLHCMFTVSGCTAAICQ